MTRRLLIVLCALLLSVGTGIGVSCAEDSDKTPTSICAFISPYVPVDRAELAKLSIGELRHLLSTMTGTFASPEACNKDCPEPAITDVTAKDLHEKELVAQDDKFRELQSILDEMEKIASKVRLIWLEASRQAWKAAKSEKDIEKSQQNLMSLLATDVGPKSVGPKKKMLGAIRDGTEDAVKDVGKAAKGGKEATKYMEWLGDLYAEWYAKFDPLERKFSRELSKTDDQGYTWLGRALVSGNGEFTNFLIEWGAPGTLQKELIRSASAGNRRLATRLINMGASVYRKPGSYSALAFADAYGKGDLFRLLQQSGCVIQVPWDPYVQQWPANILRMLEKQISRVEAFTASAGVSEHDRAVLSNLRCRMNCLRRQAAAQGMRASH
jgi:hypothetical protein